MNTVKVRDIEIGAGAPKIIVPIVGITKEDIIEEAKTFDSIPVDVVEWRVDWFDDVFATEKVLETAKELQEVLKDIPVLLTFRTSKEGGEKEISVSDYAALNIAERSASAEKPHRCFLHFPAIFIKAPRLFPLIIFSPQPQKRNFAEMDI